MGGNPLGYFDSNGEARTSVDAAVQNAVIRGNINELKTLLEYASNYSKPQVRRLIQQCKLNKKKIKTGTLDTKDADRRFYDAIKRGDNVADGKPSARGKMSNIAEFLRAVAELFY